MVLPKIFQGVLVRPILSLKGIFQSVFKKLQFPNDGVKKLGYNFIIVKILQHFPKLFVLFCLDQGDYITLSFRDTANLQNQ